MKKKILSVILVAAMAFSLAACADKKDTDKADPDKLASVSAETSVSTETSASTETSVEEVDTETSTAASLFDQIVDTEVLADDAASVFGVTEDDVYTNKFFGFKVEAPAGYSFADEEEIAAVGMSSTQKIKENNESIGKTMEYALDKGMVATDFYLYAISGLGTMNTTISSTGLGIKEDQVGAFIDTMLPTLVDTYEAAGMSNVNVERSTITCMGKEVPCILADGTIETEGYSINMYVVQIPLCKEGYMANITCGTYLTDNTADLVALIEALD